MTGELSAMTEQKIERLEGMMLEHEQADCPVTHHFGPGLYIRQVLIPAGTFAIGHYHKHAHMNVMLTGKVIVFNEDGTQTELVAPQTFMCKEGRKIGVVLEDMLWQNIYATDETDVEELERKLLRKSVTSEEHKKTMLLKENFDALVSDRVDFFEAIEEFGFTPEQVRAMSENEEDQCPLPLGSYKAVVAKSQIEGKGLRATGDIEPGECIAPARIAGMRTPVGRYTNHAKDPNAKMVYRDGTIYLHAIKPIKGNKGGGLGEEITIDYRQALNLNRKEICPQ